MRQTRLRGWVVDLLVGAGIGAVVGAIVSVNVVIYIGVEGGYEAGIGDIFRHGVWAGIVVVVILAAGPGPRDGGGPPAEAGPPRGSLRRPRTAPNV